MSAADNAAKTAEVSRDRFHEGGFEVLQFRNSGHRAGSDALLLAAALPQGASGRMADLGSGSGVAALAALRCNPSLSALMVEIDAGMADLARETLSLPANRATAKRAEVLQADVTLTGKDRETAGLHNASFDHVIMNPPYNHERQRISPDPLKALAHVMGGAGLEGWMRTACAIPKPGGILHLIYRAEKLGEIIAAGQGRFGGLTILPLHSRADAAASRVIVRARRGSKAPLAVAPGIVLHGEDGAPTGEAHALLNGMDRLRWPS